MACVTLKRPLDFDLHSPRPTKRRRCVPMNKPRIERELENSSLSSTPSVFRESNLTPGQIANNLRDEYKRLKRRRQLVPYEPRSPGSSPGHPSSSSYNPGSPGSAPSSPEPMLGDEMLGAASSASSSSSSNKEQKPIFTMKQMTMICERMCKERTDQVRDEYDRILQQKLSEQYDAFVKFIDHQIQQRFNESQIPSYLS